MERVSAYIPFKDADESLREVLPAVAGQDYPLAEIVLVDDGSATPTGVPLPVGVPTRVVRHPINLGVAAARNTGIKEVRSELVVAFDADIVPAPGCVGELVRAFMSGPGIVGAGGRVTERHRTELGDLFRSHYMKQDRGEVLLEDIDLFGGCTLYRRSALVEIGGYTEMLRNSFEDFDVARRVRERGGKTRYVPTARGEHMKRDTVISAVDTLYRWSYPHWERDARLSRHNWFRERIDYPRYYYESAVADRIETLDFKIRSDLKAAVDRLTTCSDRRLVYPLILYPIRAMLRDLINYRLCGGPLAEPLCDLFAVVLATVFNHYLPPSLAGDVRRDSIDLCTELFGSARWSEVDARVRGVAPDLMKLVREHPPEMVPVWTFLELFIECRSHL